MTRRAPTLLLAVGLSVACGPTPSPPLHDPPAVSLDQATGESVTGSIAGEAFAAADVRFRVRSGAEPHVDLWLADAPIDRCGLALPRSGTRVWLRWPARTTLEPGRFESGADASVLEAHYERAVGRAFVESHRANAIVEITHVTAERIEGRLRACFGDASESCVGGAFVAPRCLSRVDGRALREPPGLADDALEPRSPP
jgi:hypothetical protein